MIEKDDLVKTLHVPLKAAGFKKRSLSWYLNGKDTIVIVNLQRSWGRLYYINIGIWLKALGDEIFPKHYRCHIYLRMEDLFPSEIEIINTSCDLEKSELDLLNKLVVLFENKLIPFLLECVDEEKLKDQIINGSILNKNLLHRIEPRYYFFGASEWE